MLDKQVGEIQQFITEVYGKELLFLYKLPTTVVLQKTNNSVHVLDTVGYLLQYIHENSNGVQISNFINRSINLCCSQHETPKEALDLVIMSNGNLSCYSYNLTISPQSSELMIEETSS